MKHISIRRLAVDAVGIALVFVFLTAWLGCAGKLKLPDLGSVDDLIDTSKSSHEYKTQVKIEIKTDLESIPVVDMSPGIIMPPIIPLPTNTPFAAPPAQPTPIEPVNTPPVKPTAPPLEPIPTPLPGGGSDYSVSVVGIPVMTDSNKDEINKQHLFCLQSGADRIGVFHRYLQPAWPHGEWWPVYRVEYYRGCDQIAEVPLNDMEPMPGTSGTFLIDIESDGVMVTLGDNSEALSIDGIPQSGWSLVQGCAGWFESESEAAMSKATVKDRARGRLGNIIPSILR